MKLKQTLVALAMGVAAAGAHAAWEVSTAGNVTTHENTFNNTLNPDGFKNVSGGTYGYSFNVTQPGAFDLEFWYAAFRNGASVSIFGTSGSVYNGSLGKTASESRYDVINPGAGSPTGADDFFTLSLASLATGTYTLFFDTANHSKLKLDDIKMTIAAVPEPETYAMFLAGLAMMGVVARRRSR